MENPTNKELLLNIINTLDSINKTLNTLEIEVKELKKIKELTKSNNEEYIEVKNSWFFSK